MGRIEKQDWHDMTRFLIIEDCGSVQLEIYSEPRGENKVSGFIYGLWVNPDERRKGVGTFLMNVAERTAKEQGLDKVFLEWDRKDDPSFRVFNWYNKRGYFETEFGSGNALMMKSL